MVYCCILRKQVLGWLSILKARSWAYWNAFLTPLRTKSTRKCPKMLLKLKILFAYVQSFESVWCLYMAIHTRTVQEECYSVCPAQSNSCESTIPSTEIIPPSIHACSTALFKAILCTLEPVWLFSKRNTADEYKVVASVAEGLWLCSQADSQVALHRRVVRA